MILTVSKKPMKENFPLSLELHLGVEVTFWIGELLKETGKTFSIAYELLRESSKEGIF